MKNTSAQIMFGIVVIALGAVWLLDINFLKLFGRIWPFLLIGFGLYLIISSRRSSDKDRLTTTGISGSEHSGIPGLLGDIKVAGLHDGVGTIDKKLLIGDIVIDLTGAKLLEGDNIIDAAVLIGDVTMIIPENIPVKINLAACAGDLDYKGKRVDGFFPSIKHTDEDYAKAPSRLHVMGKICYGDIKIYADAK